MSPAWALVLLLSLLSLLPPALALARQTSTPQAAPQAAASASTPATASGAGESAAQRELVAVFPSNVPPQHFLGTDNKPDGFAVELFRHVAALAGYKPVVLVATGPFQAEQMLRQGKARVLPGYGISPGRENALRFTSPFEYHPINIFFRASGPRLDTLEALRGKRVALVQGSIPLERFRNNTEINILVVPTLSEAIFKTLTGEADALVFQTRLVWQAARAAGAEGALTASRSPLFEVARGIAVGVEDEALQRELDDALVRFLDTPEYQALYAKWRSSPPQATIQPEVLWLAGALAASLVGALLAWRYVSVVRINRRLTLAVSERDEALAALRLTEERQGSLLALSHMEEASLDAIISFALEEGVRLTGSAMGYLCFLEEGDVDLARFHWSKAAQKTCAMPDTRVYPLNRAGLWAECLRTRQPSIVNDYEAHADKRGLPEGHAPVLRHMAVPVVEGGRVVTVFGVGNKPEAYNEADARQLQLFLIGLWRIVQAKRSAADLVQAKEYAEELIQGANAMAISLDQECRVTLLNPAATELTGYALEDVLGRNWFELTRPPQEAKGITERFAKYLAEELPLPRRHEASIITKNGGVRHVTAQNSLLRKDGKPVGILSFAIDLTDRMQAESALAESEEKFRSLAEDSPALICRFRPGGVITYVNNAYCRTFGRSPEQLLGTSFLDLLPESEREGVRAHFLALSPRQPTKSYEHRVVLPGGGEAWQRWTDRAVFDAAGEVCAYQSVGMDISENKRAEAELTRLHHAIEQAAEGVVITDQNGVLLFANPAFQRMVGVDGDTALGRGQSILELARAELQHQDSHLLTTNEGKAWRGCVSFRCKFGPTVEVELSLSAIHNAQGEVTSYAALCRDVTEKKRLERQLWQAQKMEALGTLAGGIAHDFNNILASIMGFTELAMDDSPPDGRARTSLERVLKASRRAKELVRQILSFSRRSPAEQRHFHAGLAVREALKLLEATLPKNVVIEHQQGPQSGQQPGQPDCSVMADPSQIHQIVMNLCTNAAQAMRDTGGRILVRTGLADPESMGHSSAPHRLPPGQYFELVVQDDGPGIAPDILGRVFDPFFTTKGPGEGTGLGLAVVHGIVTGLGGSISVQNVEGQNGPGQGARFTVLLPASGQDPKARAEAPARCREGRGRILFVDDEPDILALASQALAPLGYDIQTFERPEEALSAFRSAPASVDLVITDQSMPGMAGAALAEHLRSARADLPIIVSSGYSDAIPLDRVHSLGQVRLLPKPYSMGELAESIRLALCEGGEKGNGPENSGH